MGFNVVVLSGRLTADPEIRMGTNDTKIARYTLAVDREKRKNTERKADFILLMGGELKEKTDQAEEESCSQSAMIRGQNSNSDCKKRNYTELTQKNELAESIMCAITNYTNTLKSSENTHMENEFQEKHCVFHERKQNTSSMDICPGMEEVIEKKQHQPAQHSFLACALLRSDLENLFQLFTTLEEIDGIAKCHSAGHNNNPKIAIPVLTPDRVEKRQNGRRFKDDGEPMFTLTSQDRHGVAIDPLEVLRNVRTEYGKEVTNTLDTSCNQGIFVKVSDELIVYAVWYEKYQCYIAIRKLTPKECFRLQGWSDDYFEKAQFVNSDSQLYKQAGNGVTVSVIKAIAEKLKIPCESD